MAGDVIRQGVKAAAPASWKLHHAQNLMAEQTRSMTDICRELGSNPASTLYPYLRRRDAS